MKKFAWFKHPNDLSNDKRLSALIDHEGGRGFGTYLYAIKRICMLSIELQLIHKKWHGNCTRFARQLARN